MALQPPCDLLVPGLPGCESQGTQNPRRTGQGSSSHGKDGCLASIQRKPLFREQGGRLKGEKSKEHEQRREGWKGEFIYIIFNPLGWQLQPQLLRTGLG